ncbi:PucR family transcriptional regulator [Paenibacillus sp. UNC451MF]|uniref:PucR family transcriptional regulator n=1 Tax=Paenibacillus sp. UNC451MF TaxID=1449063 RepID=UPI00048EB1A4|nr:PucR family transcriptional regulator [Paenibacillus sp. UNC451MF]
MGVTVSEALQFGGLASCKVVAGESGLVRTIESITVMEVPDVIQWLNGKVLLLTSLYSIKDDEEAIRMLVPQLAAAGSTALAIKTQTYMSEIPLTIIEAGNRLGFPIIEIPSETAYLDIMTPLMTLILKRSDTGSEQLEAFFQWIKELALGGKGIAALIEAVEQMTGNLITVGSEISAFEWFKGMSVTPLSRVQHNELKVAKRPIRMMRMLNDTWTPCIISPLLLNDELWGDVTCWQTSREFREQDFQVMDRTMMLIAMEFLKEKTKLDLEQTYKNHFLTELLLSKRLDLSEVLEKGKMFGWDFSKSYQVVCFHIPTEEGASERKGRLLLKLNSLFCFDTSDAIVTYVKELVVVLLPRTDVNNFEFPYATDPDKEAIRNKMDKIRHELSKEVDDDLIQVGIGRFYKGLEGIHKGYSEAVKALKLGTPWTNLSSVHFEDLGVYRVLNSVQDQAELAAFHSETIGKLKTYDTVHEAELLTTLKHFFENDASTTDTAKNLFVHINTIKYRLNKIEQVTGYSVHNAEQRLLLHLGLKIHFMLEAERQ